MVKAHALHSCGLVRLQAALLWSYVTAGCALGGLMRQRAALLWSCVLGCALVLLCDCRLASSTGQYVPLSAPLLEMLNWAELHKPPKVCVCVCAHTYVCVLSV